MTYRSSYNPPDKTDYSNFAFKKSEILDILKILNSNFSFDEHLKENDPKSYKDFFYSYDVFNGFEVACLISGYDPNQLSINQTRNVVWRNENPTFVQALGLVLSADKENGLFKYDQDSYSSYEFDYTISNADLKTYLIFKNIIISGFNDKEFTNINDEDLVDNTKLKNTIASLELDVAIEKQEVENLNKEIERLKAKNLELENERLQFYQKENAINEVEINLTNSDLLLISVLLRMLQNEIKVRGNKSQAKVLQRIEDEHRSIKGLSKSRTEKVLASANSLYKSLINN